jgi:hypothetical protein
LQWAFPDIKRGSYRVRFVIGEPNGKAMATMNRTLEIP